MSFWELLVIVMVALIVIRPERLPEILYLLGKWLGRIKVWYHNTLQKFNTFS